MVLVVFLIPEVSAEQCYQWNQRNNRWDREPAVEAGDQCQSTEVYTRSWSEGAPEEPPEGARPPGETVPSGTEEEPAPSPRSSAPPEGTAFYTDEGFFIYQEGR